uniref:hypothetical protein n=1 Tax=Immundisolibacter sp. TaxID=1934948 RepID=UPI0035650070
MTAAVIGGAASVVGGGKFANGAVTAAFARTFNDEVTYEKMEAQRNWRPARTYFSDYEYQTILDVNPVLVCSLRQARR